MAFFHIVTDSLEFFLLCFINRVLMVFADNRLIRWNLNHIHAVNITEFLFLGQRRTCHAGLLFKFIKKVLEGNRSQRAAFPFYLYMLLCFNRLMQPVRITASRHNAPRKLIYNQHLVIFYHIVLITEHQIVRPQRQDNIMLDFQVFCIRKIFDIKEFFDFFDTVGRQVYNLVFFIDNKVPVFFDLDTHNGIHFGVFARAFPAL